MSLLPWYIGLAVIAVVDAVIAYLFYGTQCAAPGLAQFLVLVAVSRVALVLMYPKLQNPVLTTRFLARHVEARE